MTRKWLLKIIMNWYPWGKRKDELRNSCREADVERETETSLQIGQQKNMHEGRLGTGKFCQSLFCFFLFLAVG
jgi:hypothetical protein